MQKTAANERPVPAEGISPFQPRVDACTESVLANPRAFALFLDVDGTLLELAATPRSVRIPEGLSALLQTLAQLMDGAVAILSGRLISEIDLIVGPTLLPASGVHGAELRKGSAETIERISPELPDDVVQSMQKLALSIPGVIAEPKGPGLALHYRLAPHAEADIRAALAVILEAHAGAFELLPGKRLFEIIPSGLSKGTALMALSSLPAFSGRLPIMIGDDFGDDAAFAVAERMGGYGLRVAGEYFNNDVADFGGPHSVISWLELLAEQLTAREHVTHNS